jgi:hypothetical protein
MREPWLRLPKLRPACCKGQELTAAMLREGQSAGMGPLLACLPCLLPRRSTGPQPALKALAGMAARALGRPVEWLCCLHAISAILGSRGQQTLFRLN